MELTGNDLISLINIALSYTKEAEIEQSFKRLRQAEVDVMKQDAVSRREKSAALIRFISTVDVETQKIKEDFVKYADSYSKDKMEAYEKVLIRFEIQRKKAVAEKKRLS